MYFCLLIDLLVLSCEVLSFCFLLQQSNMTDDTPCTIGRLLNEDCHKTSYSYKKGLIKLSDLSEHEKKLIKWRSEVSLQEDHSICFHHKAVFLTKYQWLQKYCCDPYNKHENFKSSK